jgi:multidrug resistance efflux pump
MLRPVCLISTILFCACGATTKSQMFNVERAEIRRLTILTGTLIAQQATVVSVPPVEIHPVSIKWLIEEGAEVKAGDRLAELDNSQLTSQLERLRSAATEAGNRLAEATSRAAGALDKASFELEQKKTAYQKAALLAAVPADILPAIEVERRRLELGKAKLELDQAEKARSAEAATGAQRVKSAQLTFDEAVVALRVLETDLDALVLRAPNDGIVKLATDFRSGRPLKSGDSTWAGSPLIRLPVLATLQIEAWLFDVDDGRVEVGMPVLFWLDAFPAERLVAKVVGVDILADELSGQSQRRAFRVRIEPEKIDIQRWRPGMSVRIEALEEAQSGLSVDRAALWSRDGAFFLKFFDDQELAVEVGACDEAHCRIEPPAAATTDPLTWRLRGRSAK